MMLKCIRAFPDGVFWLTVGQEAKLLELQTELAKAVLGDSTDRQPDFSTVQQGQTYLRSLLEDKACLLVLDDIWKVTDLAALNGVGTSGQLLVTTQDDRITTNIGAIKHPLGLLNKSQARQLLAQWTQLTETSLPPEADAVLGKCGGLPLALAMVGARLRSDPNRWDNMLHRLQSADLEKIERDFPDYPHPNLLKALAVSVDYLKPALRQRYLDFALFPEDTPIPESVLQTLWEPEGLDEYDTQDAIDELANLSLLRRDELGRVTLHDLQVDFVRKQVGAGLPLLHGRWLAAYRERCPQGWQGLVNDGYCFEGLAYHLMGSRCEEELRSLLFDFRWLQARLGETSINGLLSDYEGLTEDKTLVLVRNSLRLSAHVLAIEKEQLAGRLLGHLLGREQTEVQSLLKQAEELQTVPWLRPLHASLASLDGALLRTLVGHSSGVDSVTVLSDCRRAISASRDHTLKLWDLEQGVVIKTLEGHSAWVTSVAVLPDDKRAISASWDHTLKLWDLEQGVVIKTLEGESDWVTCIVVLPNSDYALCASTDGTLKLWDLEQGVVLKTLKGHSDSIWSLVVLPDGNRALSASADGTLKLWNLEQGIVLKTLKGHSDRVISVAVLPDGERVLSASMDGILELWNLDKCEVLQTLEGDSESINVVAVLPDGAYALSASDDNGTLKLWNLDQSEVIQILEGHSDCITSIAVLPRGDRALSASTDGTLKLWSLQQSEMFHALERHSTSINSVVALPDSVRALSASDDGTLKLWDLEQGVVLKTLNGKRWDTFMVLLPDSVRALSASDDGILKLWDLEQGIVLKTLEGHSDRVNSVVLLPDGDHALSASEDSTLKLWNLDQGVVLKTLEGHSNGVTSVAVLAGGKRALSASDKGTLMLWDLEQGVVLQTLEGHCYRINSLVEILDSNHALSASSDCTLKLWNLDQGVVLQTLEGHSNSVWSVAVSPNGKCALSASSDCTLRLWDLSTSTITNSFTGDHPFKCCTFAPDGKTVVAGDRAGKVHFFSIEP
jgi:WD40 repeat protein